MSTSAVDHYGLLTDIGRVRTHNEDALLAEPPLFAVADGLGGHQAGEIASSIAIETLVAQAPLHADSKALARAIHAANRAVIEAAEERTARSGMGTTLTAAIVEGHHIAIAHVGDSRAYLMREGQLERLTRDHSMVADMISRGQLTEEESRYHPNRSVITRALGTDPNMSADTYDIEAQRGDRLLLATDGLTGMLRDSEIAHVLESNPDPQDAARGLVAAANEAGGQDNITVVVVDIGGRASGRGWSAARASRGKRFTGGIGKPVDEGARAHVVRTWLAVLAWVAVALLIVAGAWYATRTYAWSQAYVVNEGGYVTVYRGVPGTLAGLSLRWRVEETTIPVDALDPILADRLASGIRVSNLNEALELVEQYRSEVPSAAPEGLPPGDTTNPTTHP
jgi:serine/threonine protein phosphatase PrpC